MVKRKLAVAQFRLLEWRARLVAPRIMPAALDAYREFSRTGQSGSPRQPFKGLDLWRLLDAAQPRKIAEMGSGTTSAVFSLWSAKHAAAYVAFEHSAEWALVAREALRVAGLRAQIEVVETFQVDGANGFTRPIPDDADFVYVDGPPCFRVSGKKRPNTDAYRLLEDGGLPRCIVVDGRIDTVDLIRSHPAAARYHFAPSFAYAVERGERLFPYREHSVFTLRG